MAVVHGTNGTANAARSSSDAKAAQLLDYELLLHSLEKRLALDQGDTDVTAFGDRVFTMKAHQLHAARVHSRSVIELKNDRALHGVSLLWNLRQEDTFSQPAVPPFLTDSVCLPPLAADQVTLP